VQHFAIMPLRSPGYWRARAEATRNDAQAMNGDARRQMLTVADQYDALARDAERFVERFGAPSGGWADNEPP
jgi:hypothetical protein